MASSRGEGSFPERWFDGTDPNEPMFQVHAYDPCTWIIRQSLVTHYEGPFLYLLAGEQRALLVDTGVAGGFPLRGTVDDLIGKDFPLVVAHSHSHGDHVAHDEQFVGRPDTVVVGHSPEDVAEFFGLKAWPKGPSAIDLGQRVINVLAIPGHCPSHIALYDRRSRILLTGDTLYPGRLYIYDHQAFRASVDRLIAFTADREVAHMLGGHIEMTNNPGVDLEYRAAVHLDEHQLQLGREQLLELRHGLDEVGDWVRREPRDRFVVVWR